MASVNRGSLINWQRWEPVLYRWYYALPLLSYQHKRRLVLWVHRHFGFLTRRSESYRSFERRRPGADVRDEVAPGLAGSRDYRAWFRQYVALNRRRVRSIRQCMDQLPRREITAIIPVGADRGAGFKASADSLLRQMYPHWKLVILVQDTGQMPLVRQWLATTGGDDRVGTVIAVQDRASWSEQLLDCVRTDHVALLEPGTLLHETALGQLAAVLADRPGVALVYTDEDRVTEHGHHHDPYFKPDWNPDLALAQNLPGGFCALRREHLAAALAAPVSSLPGIHELSLEVDARAEAANMVHIPRILHHRLGADAPTGNPAAIEALVRRAWPEARVEPSPLAAGSLRVRYGLPQPAPRVSLIIPTRNGLSVLATCIDSIIRRTHYPDYELLIVDNGSDEPATLAYLSSLDTRYPGARIRVLRDDRPFNYSQLNNTAAEQASGTLIGLINNDIEVIDGGWLSEMVSHALRPEIGAVGARLLYPDGNIQHAGVIVGFGGVAGHFMRHATPADGRDAARVLLVQNFTALTAACMVMRKALFQEVGGFEEQQLAVAFNDVDLCLRIRELGYRNLYTPFAVLYHHESATRGPEDASPEKLSRAQREMDYLCERWATERFEDPCYSPNLSLYHEQGAYSFPPRLSGWPPQSRMAASQSAPKR